MNKMTICAMTGAVALTLTMPVAVAADMQMSTDSKIDQKPVLQGSPTNTPTPGWEKLSKSKHWKSRESGTGVQPGADLKTDSNVVPEDKAGAGIKTSH